MPLCGVKTDMMTVTMKIETNTEVLDGIKRRVASLGNKSVIVGWPGVGSPMHQERDSKGQTTTSSTTTVAQIAVIHEFGSPAHNLPARPILKTAASRYHPLLERVTAKLYKSFLYGEQTETQALAKLGVFWEGKLRGIFTDSPGWAPLRPATIARKTRAGNTGDAILIDTGHLRRSITSAVVGASYI